MDYLVIRTVNGVKKIHISEISILIIESVGVSLTAYLLYELSRRKIEIIFCDEKRFPYGSLVPYYGSHDTSRKTRLQIQWTKDNKDALWAEIVKKKISGQIAVLKAYDCTGSELLESYIPNVEPGDVTNREGHAAKVYFNSLFGKDFSRDMDCPINSALNYGYSLLLSVITREIIASGYITQIGLFHDNVFNQYNLASDLIEPFRPFIDNAVAGASIVEFSKYEKSILIDVLNRKVDIAGKSQYLTNAVRIYVKSIFEALSSENKNLVDYPCYEF